MVLSYLVEKLLGKDKAKEELLSFIPKGGVCVEIGVWKGEFSEKVLDIVKPKKLYLIDPWKYYPVYKNRWYGGSVAGSQNDMDKLYRKVKHAFTSKRVTILRMNSEKALAKIADNSIDFTYIDGNHSYEYVKADLTGFWQKTRAGGIIAGDDLLWGIREGFPVLRAFIGFLREKRRRVSIISLKGNQFVLKKLS